MRKVVLGLAVATLVAGCGGSSAKQAAEAGGPCDTVGEITADRALFCSESGWVVNTPGDDPFEAAASQPPEPEPEPVKKTKPRPRRSDSQIRAQQRAYFQLDNIAIELDDTINPAIDATLGDADPAAAKARLEAIQTRAREIKGGQGLVDAAQRVLDALAAGDTHGLTQLHDVVLAERDALARKAMGR